MPPKSTAPRSFDSSVNPQAIKRELTQATNEVSDSSVSVKAEPIENAEAQAVMLKAEPIEGANSAETQVPGLTATLPINPSQPSPPASSTLSASSSSSSSSSLQSSSRIEETLQSCQALITELEQQNFPEAELALKARRVLKLFNDNFFNDNLNYFKEKSLTQRKDFFQLLERANRRFPNNADLWFLKGVCYRLGVVDPANPTEIFECYKTATEKNPSSAIAWNHLGQCYYRGIGCPCNNDEAFKCFRTATEQEPNFTLAWNSLGYCFKEGIGCSPSLSLFEECKKRAGLAQNKQFVPPLPLLDVGNRPQAAAAASSSSVPSLSSTASGAASGLTHQSPAASALSMATVLSQPVIPAIAIPALPSPPASSTLSASSSSSSSSSLQSSSHIEETLQSCQALLTELEQQNLPEAELALKTGRLIELLDDLFKKFRWKKAGQYQAEQKTFFQLVERTSKRFPDNAYLWLLKGLCYEHWMDGHNTYKAFECFKKALEQDSSLGDAWDGLGGCYEHGIGCLPDCTEAYKCYKRARLAQNNQPVPPLLLPDVDNRPQAVTVASSSSSSSSLQPSSSSFEEALKSCQALLTELEQKDVPEAKLAPEIDRIIKFLNDNLKYFNTVANSTQRGAFFQLVERANRRLPDTAYLWYLKGGFYDHGIGGLRPKNKTFECFETAIEKDSRWGFAWYSLLEDVGHLSSPSYAFGSYKTAAGNNASDASNWVKLGIHYQKGFGCPRNNDEAFKCFRTATEQDPNLTLAWNSLGYCFKEGIGCSPSLSLFEECKKRAGLAQNKQFVPPLPLLDVGNRPQAAAAASSSSVPSLSSTASGAASGLTHQSPAASALSMATVLSQPVIPAIAIPALPSPPASSTLSASSSSSSSSSLQSSSHIEETLQSCQALLTELEQQNLPEAELALKTGRLIELLDDLFKKFRWKKAGQYQAEQKTFFQLVERTSKRFPDNAYLWLLKGLCYRRWMDGHNTHKAFECFKKALDQDSSLGNAWDGLGDCYQLGIGCLPDRTEAFKCYKRATENDPSVPNFWDSLGNCFKGGLGCSSDPSLVKECKKRARLAKNNQPVPPLLLPDVDNRLQAVTVASSSSSSSSLQPSSSSFEEALKSCQALLTELEQKDVPEAKLAPEIDRIIKFLNDNLKYFNTVANSTQRGAFFQLVERANRRLPDTAYLWYLKGGFYENRIGGLDSKNKAFECFETAIEKDSRWGFAWYSLLEDFMYLYSPSYAFGSYKTKTATENNASDASDWVKLGIHYQKGFGCPRNNDEAFKCFRTATEQDPNLTLAWNSLGYCFKEGIGCSPSLSLFEECKKRAGLAQNKQFVPPLPLLDVGNRPQAAAAASSSSVPSLSSTASGAASGLTHQSPAALALSMVTVPSQPVIPAIAIPALPAVSSSASSTGVSPASLVTSPSYSTSEKLAATQEKLITSLQAHIDSLQAQINLLEARNKMKDEENSRQAKEIEELKSQKKAPMSKRTRDSADNPAMAASPSLTPAYSAVAASSSSSSSSPTAEQSNKKQKQTLS